MRTGRWECLTVFTLALILLTFTAGCLGVHTGSVTGTVAGDYRGGMIHVVAINASLYCAGDIREMETSAFPEMSPMVSGSTTLKAPGTYRITGLDPGTYFLYAWADTKDNGWIDHQDYQDPTGWYQTPEHLSLTSFTIRPDEERGNINISLISPASYEAGEVNVASAEGGGRLTRIRDRWILQLWGTPEARAYAMGYLCGPQIRDWIDYVLIESFMVTPSQYEELAIPFITTHMAEANPGYMAQIDALVRGMKEAGVDLRLRSLDRDLTRYDVLAENAYPFMLYYRIYGLIGGDLGDAALTGDDAGIIPSLCSSTIAWGNRTMNDELRGGVIHGKNMDGENDLRKVTVNSLLVVASTPAADEGDRRVVGFDWPGFIGTFNGMNEDGLVLVPHSSPSIPDWNATDLLPYTFLYMETLRNEESVDGAWQFWIEHAGTRTGGHNAGVSAPYLNGTGSVPVCFEADSYGGLERMPGYLPPSDRFSLLITNNFFEYEGTYPPAVEKVQGYHAAIEPENYRYRDMLALLNRYATENRTIGTPEVIAMLQAASTSLQYHGTTEYSFIAYPDKGLFAIATEDLQRHILDAPFSDFTCYEFEEVFA